MSSKADGEGASMGKIVRYEFVGDWFVFGLLTLLCLVGIGIPPLIMYLFLRLVRIEEPMESPTEFMEAWKSRTGRRPRRA
jgi:hypothetical protein